jgi:sulfatase maturation enzyme AslB (radical SAM superfamily)
MPLKAGNIYHNHLSEIINCSALIQCREESLSGYLSCYKDCNWTRCEPDQSTAGSIIHYNQLKNITIVFGELCNISCIMCNQRMRKIPDVSMLNHDILIKNVDISPFNNIFLTGGEPLLIPECLNYMKYLASINKKFSLSTNGMLLTEEMSDFLSPNLNFITFSINAFTKKTHEYVNSLSSFDKILSNINYLKKRRSLDKSNFDIIGRMTLTVHSLMEIPEFIIKYKEYGFDKINFGYDKSTVPFYLANNSSVTLQLKKEIQDALTTSNSKHVDFRRLEMLGLINKS